MKLSKSIKKWFQNNRRIITFIFAISFVWHFLVSLEIVLVKRSFPAAGRYLYSELQEGKIINPQWLWPRANFDGIHYLGIAKKGYGLYQQAFFPLYPRMIKILTPIFGGRDLLAALSISGVCFFWALFFFYKLIKLDWEDKYAQKTIIYLLIFPTAFFFSAVYTESLFLFLIFASFYFARTKRWWFAGIFGLFASATRLTGIFLLPALAVEFWQQLDDRERKNWRSLVNRGLPLFLIPLGLIYYMHFLQIHFHDSLLFAHVQPYFGAGRTEGKIILLYQVFWRYLKMLITVQKTSPTYLIVVLESMTGAMFLILTIFVYLRRWYPYAVFMALAYILPTLSGTLSSLPRYVLVLFPGFMLLALWGEKYRWLEIFYVSISATLMVFFLWFFIQGYWVA